MLIAMPFLLIASPLQQAAPLPADPPPPMSDKDQAALRRCQQMRPAQVAQSSRCTKLIGQAKGGAVNDRFVATRVLNSYNAGPIQREPPPR